MSQNIWSAIKIGPPGLNFIITHGPSIEITVLPHVDRSVRKINRPRPLHTGKLGLQYMPY